VREFEALLTTRQELWNKAKELLDEVDYKIDNERFYSYLTVDEEAEFVALNFEIDNIDARLIAIRDKGSE
jgi:hypothetical protein